MSEPREIIWNAITESAKARFDYSAFEKAFADFDDSNIAENVLFMTIAGHAAGHSVEDIATHVKQKFLLIGYGYDNDALTNFILNRRSDLWREIEAMETALLLFQQGLQTPAVLVQTRSLLSQP